MRREGWIALSPTHSVLAIHHNINTPPHTPTYTQTLTHTNGSLHPRGNFGVIFASWTRPSPSVTKDFLSCQTGSWGRGGVLAAKKPGKKGFPNHHQTVPTTPTPIPSPHPLHLHLQPLPSTPPHIQLQPAIIKRVTFSWLCELTHPPTSHQLNPPASTSRSPAIIRSLWSRAQADEINSARNVNTFTLIQ